MSTPTLIALCFAVVALGVTVGIRLSLALYDLHDGLDNARRHGARLEQLLLAGLEDDRSRGELLDRRVTALAFTATNARDDAEQARRTSLEALDESRRTGGALDKLECSCGEFVWRPAKRVPA